MGAEAAQPVLSIVSWLALFGKICCAFVVLGPRCPRWVDKTLLAELKQLKGIKSFGAVNWWRYWRVLTGYPAAMDKEYTEVGPGTRRGLNMM